MSTITQEEFEAMTRANIHETTVKAMLEYAGITVEEPPYVPSKPGEFFTDKDGDLYIVNPGGEASRLASVVTYPVSYFAEHYSPLKPYLPGE